METHIFALIGLSLLCGAWVLFQRWLAKQDPDKKEGYKPGCGACSSKSCPTKKRSADISGPGV
ncbi:MAG: hypothetical protein ABW085_02965 [Sedimenticola sp.]